MIDATTREELSILRDSVRKFMEQEIVPHRERWRQEGKVDRDLWRRAGDAGLLLVSTPEEYGGLGGNFRHEAIIIEELARIGFPDFGIALHNGIIAPYILHWGTEEQKRRWLPKLASGEMVGALAMTEPGAGSDVQAIRTRAIADGNGYVINGSKIFITNGQHANLILVACKTDPTKGSKGTSLVAVETDTAEGFRRGRNLEKVGMKAQDTSELFFDDVKVPTTNLLGTEPGRGFYQMMQELPQERLIVAVQAVAAIEAAVEATINYTKDRSAFGKSILDFQNTRFVLAEVKSEAVIGRIYINHCIEELVAGRFDATGGAMSKWWTTEKQCEIIDRCLQLFGGYGYMSEFPISHMWADARVQKIYGGTNEIMKELIARSL